MLSMPRMAYLLLTSLIKIDWLYLFDIYLHDMNNEPAISVSFCWEKEK
jgi:hypothetical protein